MNNNEEKTIKLRKRLKKLSLTLMEFAPQEIEELRRQDTAVESYCRNISLYIGSSNPYWRIHPIYNEIKCSINGEIEISGKRFSVREYNGKLTVFYSGGKHRIPAASLILECFEPCPGDRTEYQIGYIDKNSKNIKPSNLYWKRIIVR